MTPLCFHPISIADGDGKANDYARRVSNDEDDNNNNIEEKCGDKEKGYNRLAGVTTGGERNGGDGGGGAGGGRGGSGLAGGGGGGGGGDDDEEQGRGEARGEEEVEMGRVGRRRRDAALLHLYTYPEKFIEVFVVADLSMLQFYGPKEIHIYLLTMMHIVSLKNEW